MKKISKLLVLTALLLGWTLPSWGQASTQGKEFWVGLTMSIRPPDDGDGEATPYLAISTREATTITITNPAYPNDTIEKTIPADRWYKVEDIPLGWWYPSGVGNPTKIKGHADEINKFGIHIKASKNISVFAIIRANAGMDASNILPVTAIQTEYILQDYVPHAKSSDRPYITMATIVATEDNTEVHVKPSCPILTAAQPKLVSNQITLNKGETYYLMAENDGQNNNSLSGTEITADKKIAVFQGIPCTYVPHDVGNRDCLYEQAMPIDYWGTQFVVTRSYAKGANFIRITASTDGTTINVNGNPAINSQGNPVSINRGETFEIELRASNNMNNTSKLTRPADLSIMGNHLYVETSCPCAVYSYDVGKGYNDKDKTELSPDDQQEGDPSSVWIAPIEQAIDKITFGVCGTNRTEYHYIDIIVPTATASQTVITPAPQDNTYNPSTSFIPVNGNPDYSFARIYLTKADGNSQASFTISNPKGFVAHVYGNGDSESYAYSVGSAAVELGVKINGETFVNGYFSDRHYCIGSDLEFDANVGGKFEVTRVFWEDFGDGVSENSYTTTKTYTYLSKGWKTVKVHLYGHQVCTTEDDMPLGTLNFSFFVGSDTIHHVQYEDEGYEGDPIDTIPYDCDSVVVIHHKIIKTCMDLQIPESQQVCNGEDLEIPFSYPIGGKHGKAYLCKVIHDPSAESGYHLDTLRDQDVDIKGDVVRVDGRNVDRLTLPISTWDPGKYTVCILMEDFNCTVKNEAGEEFPTLVQSNALYITVKYPADIFAFKFNNVLAVYQNKGYEFAHYEWHLIRNDQDTIIGGDQSVYHTEEAFTPGDEYYVMLTEKGKEPVPSCSFTVPEGNKPDNEEEPGNGGSPEDAPKANKKIVNSRICVEFDGRTYDMYGQRVK